MVNRETKAPLLIPPDEPLTVELLFDAIDWVSNNRNRQRAYTSRALRLEQGIYTPLAQNPKRIVRGDLADPKFHFPGNFNKLAAAEARANLRATSYRTLLDEAVASLDSNLLGNFHKFGTLVTAKVGSVSDVEDTSAIRVCEDASWGQLYMGPSHEESGSVREVSLDSSMLILESTQQPTTTFYEVNLRTPNLEIQLTHCN